jgi:hypothetical protein
MKAVLTIYTHWSSDYSRLILPIHQNEQFNELEGQT